MKNKNHILVDALELASELAEQHLEDKWSDSITIWDGENFTDQAQEIYNELHDYYLSIIESTQVKK